MSKMLTCPECGAQIPLDEGQYAKLLDQVRTDAFEDELESRLALEKRKVVVSCKETYLADEEKYKKQVQALKDELTEKRFLCEQLELKAQNQIQAALMEQRDAFHEEKRQLETELEYYKDLKSRMSTKMVGESLERHCMDQFNSMRMMAFPNAYFEKDNDARTGSKGDFIFREEQDGTELLSIMFEMKHEMDTTATKHKNEDFLKELDKDRREKHCEYAILVSLLEADSEYYNQGIVDMSYKYEKMYVVRPQCFLTIIGLLRNAALRSMEDRRKLQQFQEQNLDVVRFSDQLGLFKDYVTKNYDLASRHFEKAVEGIDKTIDQLTKIKKELLSSERNLRLLSDKTEDLTVKSLTKQSPGLREAFVRAGVEIE